MSEEVGRYSIANAYIRCWRIANPPEPQPGLTLGRICNPTAASIRIFNPQNMNIGKETALQMLIFGAGGLQIRQSQAKPL